MTERNCFSLLREAPEVMTVIEVAKLLRLGKNKTYALIKSGRLSTIKVGGKIIVPKTCIVAFLGDAKNYQVSSQIISDNRWTSEKTCDIIGVADRAAKTFTSA